MNKMLCNVSKVKFEYHDRKILILDWFVEMEDSGCFSAMNVVLDTYDQELKQRIGTVYGTEMIRQTLEFFGVNNFSDIKNYKCYLLTEKDRIWCSSDVLGFEQLPFDEYKNNQLQLIKSDVLELTTPKPKDVTL